MLGFFDISVGSWEDIFWSLTIENISVVDTLWDITREIFRISRISRTSIFMKIQQILYTLSIHWSRDNASKSIPRVFGHLRNSQFSHLSPCQCAKDADQRNETSNPSVCFVDLQWIKRSPKIHPQKLKEKVGKRTWGKKKTLTSISSARALSRLFSFWLFNKESYFLTFFEMWRKFPFLVWCKMRCKQHMQSKSRTKAHEKRQHFAGGLSLFSIRFPKTFFRPYLAFF